MYKFKEKISNFEVCLTTDYNDWHILPTKLIDDIASGIRDGKWYTVLGPPRCQKSFLLKSILSKLQNDKASVILDLKELRSYQETDLLRKFCILIRNYLNKLNLSTCTCFDGKIRDANQVVIKLKECLSIIKQDLVLFIDHIEKIKIGPLMLLFDVFENIYSTQKENDPYRLTLVLASSFIVPSMAQKQTPIPDFAEVILIQDLCPDANKILLDCFAEINSVEITDNARKLCIDYASDDREVIFKLLKYAYFQSEDHPIEKLPIRERDVQKAIDWFINYESKSYVPLRKTIRAIENSPPEIMLYVLGLIESGSFLLKHPGDITVPQTKVDPLLLTGAVRGKIKGNRYEYIIRNKIYQRCLKDYFHCDRVVNICKTSGNWDIAITYLENVAKHTPAFDVKLLETIVSSIYVAKVEDRAYNLLLRALTNVFKIAKVRIYIINTAQTNFIMVSQKGVKNYPANLPVEAQSTAEIQAYLCKDYIVDIPKDKNQDEVLIMPLLKDEDNVFGLVAMHNFKDYHLSDEFQDLLSFLKRSGEAIGTVIERQKQAKRLQILQGISSGLVSKLDTNEILNSIGQHISELLEADSSLFLIVDKQKRLITEKCGHNYDDVFLNQLEFDELMEGVSGEVLETGKPCKYENTQALSKGKALKHAEEHNTGPIIVAPLLAKTHIGETDSLSKFHSSNDIQEKEIKQQVIGTLTACRKIGKPPFANEDYDLACMLALQAAVAIENAKLYERVTAVARMGMASSIVQHSIRKKAITIKNEIELINSILQIDINSMLGDRLSKIDKSALNLLNLVDRSIIAPLCSDDITGFMSINNLIRDARDAVHNNQKDRPKPFTVDFISSIDDSVRVLIHSKQFQKIFSTLLDNSIEAMHNCNNKQIDVCANESEGMIEITIQDFGCGISPEIQSKLFKEQIKNSDRNKGLGIGLFLANTTAQLYGGSIEIGNTCKDGTKMILKFPYETEPLSSIRREVH